MLMNQAAKSGYVTIQQEAINEAASQLNMILGYQWDESNTDDEFIPPILKVTNGDSELEKDLTRPGGRRIGIPDESSRSFIRRDTQEFNASTSLGSESGDIDDIDDFGGTGLTDIETSSNDYVENTTVSIGTSVTYMSDSVNYNATGITFTPSSGSTSSNIKGITVTLTSSSGETELLKTIILHAFSSNIGGYILEERSF